MSDFGDFDDDDAYDVEPADPEQVAAKLHGLRVALDQLAGEQDLPRWVDLLPVERALAIGIAVAIVNWLTVNEPDSPEDAARHLHNVRRFLPTSTLPPWDELSEDERAVGIGLMAVLIAWLERQGAIT